MNSDELNLFIARYATQYATKTAMMLTGAWGSGKSYYINKVMVPYLKKREVKCVVVSLYGVHNLADLSKQIYLSLRGLKPKKKSETKEYLSIVGRSIINNALAFKGVSINPSDDELRKLYESVDLKKVLLVIEDVERSTIDILKLLGFINGLVEYDGAKVLLVANENELLKIEDAQGLTFDFSSITGKEETKEDQIPEDEAVICYKRIKEKTIGDTIQFKADVNESVKSILNGFSGVWVKALSSQNEIEKISGIIVSHCKQNLRMLIYSLQKCNDIFVDVADARQFEDSFYQVAFEGMLMISDRFLSSDIPAWEGTQYISAQLGSLESPVFRFVYDYLRWNSVDLNEVISASEEYENYRYFEKNATRDNDEDLFILSNYHIQTEDSVINALANIEKKLKEKSFVGVYAYEKLGYLAIKAGEVVGYNPDNICSIMIKNASRMCKKQHLSSQEIIWGIYGGESDSKAAMNKYHSFIMDLSTSIEGNGDSLIDFSYKPEDIHKFYLAACRNKLNYIVQHKFISRFEISKVVSMLGKCSSEQINDFRGILFVFYRNVAKNEYDEADVEALSQLLTSIEKKKKGKNNWDKIQLLQIDYLRSNVNEFIEKMQ